MQIELRQQPHPAHLVGEKRPFLVRDEVEPDRFSLFIDNSARETVDVCNRKAELYIVERRELCRPSAALTFGGALHAALDVRYSNSTFAPDAATILAQHEAISNHYSGIVLPLDEYRTPSYATEVITQYNSTYGNEPFTLMQDDKGKNLVECSFAVPLGVVPVGCEILYEGAMVFCKDITVIYTGKIDLPVMWDGEIVVIDHKSTSMGGSTFFDQFRLASQTIGYCWALTQLLGRPVTRFCLNALIVRKPTKTGTGIELLRERFVYDQSMIDEWVTDTMHLVTEFINNLIEGYFPKKTVSCIGKYGKCQYFDVCSLPVSYRPTMLASNLFQDVTWSPLTTNQPKTTHE